MDRRHDPARIISVLAALGADIVALQEVDFRLAPRRAALPSAPLTSATDLCPLPFATGKQSLGWHGQTILLHRRLKASAVRRIALPGLEPRGAILTEIETEQGPMRIVGVHLGLIRRYRHMQLAAITAAIGRRTPMPTVVIGDFNEWSRRDGKTPLPPDFRLHAPGASYPALRPIGALDRIALSQGLHLKAAGVYSQDGARRASDHLPVWADIAMDSGTGAKPLATPVGPR
jgi:endonuclease/exonuclease/phosphatase family metal-dependent hydrolase